MAVEVGVLDRVEAVGVGRVLEAVRDMKALDLEAQQDDRLAEVAWLRKAFVHLVLYST
jgi:hypothetical protein